MPFAVDKVFTYHRPHSDQAARYEKLRNFAKQLAQAAEDFCPESREKSVGFTNLQQAVMWFNASIAINEAE